MWYYTLNSKSNDFIQQCLVYEIKYSSYATSSCYAAFEVNEIFLYFQEKGIISTLNVDACSFTLWSIKMGGNSKL